MFRRVLIIFVLVVTAAAQKALQQQIADIAAQAQGKVSVACSLPGSLLDCDLNPRAHPPMQSVFKLPLAIAVLHQVEQGKYQLDQAIRFRSEDLILPKPYSPLQDKYPTANVDVPLQTLLEMTVSLSDNTAADILLRLAGGPRKVGEYITLLGITGFHLRDSEGELHRWKSRQYRNWFEARGAVQLLRMINDHSPVTPEHTALLLKWMRPGERSGRLDGSLPDGVKVAHKSGSSDVEHGLAAATNDIGLIPLPDGRQLAIAVFVSDSTADYQTRAKTIALIGKSAYEAGSKK